MLSDYRILVIEDQNNASTLIVESLREHGFNAEKQNLSSCLKDNNQSKYNLIILDGSLTHSKQKQTRKDLAKLLSYKIPGICISSCTKNCSFNMEILCKPFHISDLIIKVQNELLEIRPLPKRYKYTLNNLEIDLNRRTIKKDDNLIHISKKQSLLLKVLLEYKGNPISRKDILRDIWNAGYTPSSGTIDVHINSLRKILSPLKKDQYIKTIYGFGYMIEDKD